MDPRGRADVGMEVNDEMPELLIAPSVAEVIGAEQVDRMRRDPTVGIGTCIDCQRSLNASAEDVSVVVLLADPDIVELELLALAHERCSASELRSLSAEQTVQLVAAAEDASVSAVASLWPGDGSDPDDRPVLFVSFHSELSIKTEQGAQVNILTEHFLQRGWDLVRSTVPSPIHKPLAQEAMCRLTVYPEVAPSGFPHFRLQLVDDASMVADIESLEVPWLWLDRVRTAGAVDVYVGPLSVHQWLDQVDRDIVERAVQAGELVGAVVVTQMID